MNTTATTSDVRLLLKKFIRARRERVFAAWTQAELMKRWFAPGAMTVAEAVSDPRVGGAYRIRMAGQTPSGECGPNPTVVGKYTKIIPNELIVFTWQWEGDPATPETVVTIELREVDGGTEVTLTHVKLPSEESKNRHQHGWTGCLDNLVAFVEKN